MNEQDPDWDFVAGSEEAVFRQSSGNDGDAANVAVRPDSGLSEHNLLFRTPCGLNSSASEEDDFPDIFRALMDVQFHPVPVPPLSTTASIVSKGEFPRVSDGAESSGEKRKADEIEFGKCLSEETDGISGESEGKHNDRSKRIRSAEIHNLSERRRRDRVKEKMRALKELIPNCNKSDRASMLDDAIEYLKTLKLQVQMMSMGGGAICQSPYMLPSGIQSIQVPHISPFVHMRPVLGTGMGFGMGMVSMCCPTTGFPMISVPSASIHPPLSAAARPPLMSGSGVLPHPPPQVPFIPSQPLPETAATTKTLVTEFSPTFNISNQGESSSQNTPITSNDFEHVPNISQKSTPTGSHSVVQTTHIIPPSMGGHVMAEAPQLDEEAGSADSKHCKCDFLCSCSL